MNPENKELGKSTRSKIQVYMDKKVSETGDRDLFLAKQTQETTLEDCLHTPMLLGKPNTPRQLVAYDLMLNLPAGDIDTELERRKAREEFEKEGISEEERKYIEAKLYVLELMDKYR